MEKASMGANAPEKDNAIEKALKIMTCFLPVNNELSNLEIAERLGYHKATTSRILKLLTEHSFLYQNKSSKRYSLGNMILQLSNASHNSFRSNIVAYAHPYLLRLRDVTGFNVSMDIISADSIILVAVIQGSGPMVLNMPIGTTMPWNTSNGLKAALAFGSNELKERFFKKEMVRLNDKSITNLEEYRRKLMEIREVGYAYAGDEPSRDCAIISIPIFDFKDEPVAAVSLTGGKNELGSGSAFLLDALRDAAKSISAVVSFR